MGVKFTTKACHAKRSYFLRLKIIPHFEDFSKGEISTNAVESIVGLYKNRCGLRFDKEAAESLGLDGKTFSNYMKGRRRLLPLDSGERNRADGRHTRRLNHCVKLERTCAFRAARP